MKISLCIPQYNRIEYLLLNLKILEEQTYDNIEVVISDDCSKDDTEQQIAKLKAGYRFPIVYNRNPTNFGYDRNLRRSMELATGEYCVILGNDDTLFFPEAISKLVDFLQKNNLPELGYANMTEASDTSQVFTRAKSSEVIGTGPEIAFKYYSCFSFVGGLIFKKSAFDKFNTSKHDGSIYVQMYLSTVMISSGMRVFSFNETLVLKDLVIGGKKSNSYLDTLPKSWKEYKVQDGGIPSVINVLISGFRDAGKLSTKIVRNIFRHIYSYTYPNWVIEYKGRGSYAAAFGLAKGIHPRRVQSFKLLGPAGKAEIKARYYTSTVGGMIFPYFLFTKLKSKLYAFVKKFR